MKLTKVTSAPGGVIVFVPDAEASKAVLRPGDIVMLTTDAGRSLRVKHLNPLQAANVERAIAAAGEVAAAADAVACTGTPAASSSMDVVGRLLAMETDVSFLSQDVVLAVHDENITMYGGSPGLGSLERLEMALEQPLTAHAYGGIESIGELAAILAQAIVANHPFLDGNERTALYCMVAFLQINGMRLEAGAEDISATINGLAEQTLSGDRFSDWVVACTRPVAAEQGAALPP